MLRRAVIVCIRDRARRDAMRLRHSGFAAFITVAFGVLVLSPASAQPVPSEIAGPAKIEVSAREIPTFDTRERSRTRFGSLEYRGGLVLTSPHRGFGGISGFRFLDPGGENFLALSDKGDWFTGKLVYRGTQVIGMTNVETAPILGPDGKPITTRQWFDTEALALDGGLAYVGIERVNQVLKFDFGRDGVRAAGQPLALSAAAQKLPFNKGIESLAFVPKPMKLAGTLIAISERGLDSSGNIVGFLIGGPSPGQFSVKRSLDFDISDAVLLPSGDLLILERKFSLLTGVRIRIRRIAMNTIAPGRVLDGPQIFDADLGNEVDNMETLDVHQTAAGETVLTMMSDDNFSVVQRNLLLQFTLKE